jgi:environmental stress-induced protein Ves
MMLFTKERAWARKLRNLYLAHMPILNASNRRRVPWKNGGGMTLEIATDAATIGGDWSWRISIADVPQRSTFSMYPGVDRFMMRLDGTRLDIVRGENTLIVPDTDTALAFAGEEEVVGIPTGTGVRDVNLMVRRDRWRGALHILRDGCMRADAPKVLVHAARGDIGLHVHGEPELQLLREEQTLMCYGCVEITNTSESAAIVCQLWPIDAPH